MNLILASGSKQRKDILNMLGLKYDIIVSCEEELSTSKDPNQYVIDLSKIKANSVSKKINKPAIIIAADSIIYMNNHIFEKPKDKKEAFDNMKKMSGKTTYAITGVTIKDLYKNKEISFSDCTEVIFNTVTDEEISWYVENESHILERAGYSVGGKASLFVNQIIGDYNNVLGLPISKLFQKLQGLGYSLYDFELN